MKTPLLSLITPTDDMRPAIDARFDLVQLKEMPEPDEWLRENGANFEYLLTQGSVFLTDAQLDMLPNLKAASTFSVGYDKIDATALCERGIMLGHTPGVLTKDVAGLGLLLFLSCFRNFEAALAHARSGNWATNGRLSLARSPENRRVGIVGLGRIGREIARKLSVFDAEISYHGRSQKPGVEYTYFPDLLDMANSVEVLINIAPGGEATRHMISDSVLRALGPNGVFINVGRGSTVDQTALINALSDGGLGFAGLDVYAAEPDIPAALRALPNVHLTGHIASSTTETWRAMSLLAIENLTSFLDTGRMIAAVPECADM